MANTFFGFNTAINDHAERLGSSPEDIEGLEAEEEYDALNDETFGGLGDQSEVDWEEQHEQLAEIAESSKHGTDLESFLDHLGINDNEESVISKDASVWAYNSDGKNGDKLYSFLENSFKPLPNLNQYDSKPHMSPHQNFFGGPAAQSLQRPPSGNQQVLPSPKLRTVEDLERTLIYQSKSPINYQQQPNHALQQPPQQFQHGGHREMPRFPPGFQPMPMPPGGPPPPGIWHPMHHGHVGHQMPPPGMVRMLPPGPQGGPRVPPPHMMPPAGPPPGFMNHSYPHGPGFHMNPHFNFPPPPRVGGMPQNMMPNRGPAPYNNNNNNNKQQRPENYNNRGRSEYQSSGNELKDEYAGLMNNREKQWLLNIQLLQVNTGTPYFDDYYYTVFKERQAKNKENIPENRNNNNQRYHNNRFTQQRDGNVGHHHGGNHRNSSQETRQQQQQQQQQDQNPLNKKVYTPLQFENSLGKLQFGSITAPRKIIDMDIIQLEKDSDSTQTARDSRKTKQLLLELEALYTMILKAEDLKNPVAVSNTEKLMELKQKQRLREMEAAPTPEQKREVLKLLQEESVAPVENQTELLAKIVGALLQDEKLASFVGIRKGKMLLLRVLPHLSWETYTTQLLELWIKLLLSIPLIGRRDTIGDNILPRFHSHFKRFINAIELEQILEILSSLVEIVKLENSRSTPLSHQSKSPLYFIVSNKFGISAISTILHRVATLLAEFTDKHTSDWSNFMTNLIDTLSLVATTTPIPLEPITDQQLNRLGAHLTADKLTLLEKTFVDSN